MDRWSPRVERGLRGNADGGPYGPRNQKPANSVAKSGSTGSMVARTRKRTSAITGAGRRAVPMAIATFHLSMA
jgi:hypothetical protein